MFTFGLIPAVLLVLALATPAALATPTSNCGDELLPPAEVSATSTSEVEKLFDQMATFVLKIDEASKNKQPALHAYLTQELTRISDELATHGISTAEIQRQVQERVLMMGKGVKKSKLKPIQKLRKTSADLGLELGLQLVSAARDGDYEKVKLLIKKGANVNTPGVNNETALHFACSNGNIRIVKLLVRAGASQTAQNVVSRTPMMLAATYGHLAIIRWFVEKKQFKLDKYLDTKGRNELNQAILNGQDQIAEYLIQKGANVNHVEKKVTHPFFMQQVRQTAKF